MPWYRWKDPSREGVETRIRTTGGRVVKGRIVSHGAEVDDLRRLDVTGRPIETTVIDDEGRYVTGRELGDVVTAPPAAA